MSIQYNCNTCKERKFLLFAGRNRGFNGGWDDFVGIYDTVEEATKITNSLDEESWFEVVSMETLTIVRDGYCKSNKDEWFGFDYLS